MNILFFTNEYAHHNLPAAGGVGSFFKIMATQLVKEGHTVKVYGFSKKKHHFFDGQIEIEFFKQYNKKFPLAELGRSLSSKLNNQKLEYYWLKKERKYLAKKLKQFALKHHIDIIQSFTFNGFTAYWDNSIPLVTRYHGSRGFWNHFLGHTGNELKIQLEKKALQQTPYTVANSHFSKSFIKKYYDVEVKKVIHNGINTEVFKPIKQQEKIPQSIFYFGTLSDAKGVDRLAKIFNKVHEKFPEASLYIIGKNENYFNNLKTELITKNAKSNVNYYGHISLLDLPKHIAKAALVIVPSKGETFGFTIVEAMALQKVTIVSNIPVAKEIITHQEDGFIANTDEDFINHISEVFQNPEAFSQMEKKAREKVIKNFSQELMVNNSFKYYEEILAEKK